ncbi:MAG TPA: hypothetical protein VH475_10830 [Tepidisphaeraceae bacterium]
MRLHHALGYIAPLAFMAGEAWRSGRNGIASWRRRASTGGNAATPSLPLEDDV